MPTHTFSLTGPDPFDAIRDAGLILPRKINMDHAECTAEGILITLPARKIGAENGFCFNAMLPAPVPWAAVSWECMFLPGFDFGRGGKFGFGLDNRKGTKTWSGGAKPGKNGGGSCRFMWREHGVIHGYTYHPDQKEKTGEYTEGLYHRSGMHSIDRHRVVMSLSEEKGGFRAYSCDDTASIGDFGFRFGPAPINKITCDFFRGGSMKDWAVKTDGRILVRNLTIEY